MTIEFDKTITGSISFFGGPEDKGVSPSEGLALYEYYDENPYLFLQEQPVGTTGLARRLNPKRNYCAMRWDYSITPKNVLRNCMVLIKNIKTEKVSLAAPADWGPAEHTGRVVDVSPKVMEAIGTQTDDIVECTLIKPVYIT